jgi:serine/threonine protein kinase/tetratricopeptide (TPR) repeat protein
MPADPRRVKELFVAAIDLTDPQARQAFLERECGDDADLRQRLEALLQAHDNPNPVVNAPLVGIAPPEGETTRPEAASPSELLGTIIAGKYKLLQVIGEGGMGAVFMADQLQPVKRRVAVKLIKAGLDSRNVLARFESERQALALMDHPNIAKVLDAGTVGDARAEGRGTREEANEPATPPRPSPLASLPYFVMELVKGIPLTEYCDQNRLSVGDRLALFRQICSAVHHAHQKGIIHRDLKPSNILVESHDGKPVPKVIDFGLAKAVSGMTLTENTLFTALGTVAGTPLYMAPEQAAFNAIDIDTRADIFALGVILYELLTGSTPITRDMLKKAAFDELLRVVREQEPPTPSKRISTSEALPTVAANRQMEPIKLGRFVKGDLDWIVMKALAKERDRRYESATAFAQDIERFLNHEPVSAGPPTVGYKLRKFVKRNKVQVVAGLLVLATVLVGIAGTTFGLLRAEIARDKEAEQRGIAEDKQKEAEDEKERAEAEKKRAILFRNKAHDALEATTGEDVELLLGGKQDLGPNERAYLESIIKRWQTLGVQEGSDEYAQATRSEGIARVAFLRYKLGRFADAMSEFQQALPMLQELVKQFPDRAKYKQGLANIHANQGNVLRALSRHQEALNEYQKARDLQQKLAELYSSDSNYQHALAITCTNLAALLSDLGKRDQALREYEQARDIELKLVERFPEVPVYQEFLASNYDGLGSLFNELGDSENARTQLEKALDIGRKLVEKLPDKPEYQLELATTHHNLGVLLEGLKRLEQAYTEYGHVRDMLHKLSEQFPSVPEYQSRLASVLMDVGRVFTVLGQLDEALAEYQKSMGVRRKLANRFPTVPQYQVELGASYSDFGVVLQEKGKPAESLEWFEKAIITLAPLVAANSRDLSAKDALRNCHAARAVSLDHLRKYSEAIKEWAIAMELSPENEQFKVRAGRVMAFVRVGRVDEAIADVAEVTAPAANTSGSYKWNAGQWYDFTRVYALASAKVADKKKAYADRAMELLHKAVQAGYKDAAHMAKDSDLDPLRDREDFKKLMEELKKK